MIVKYSYESRQLMKELPNNVIRNCNEKKLLNLKRIVLDYIKEFKLEDITWKSLTKEKMRKFLFDNYYINNNFITWNDNDTIFGMHYLQWHLYTDKYFIGTIKNNIDKETIVGCISYFNYHKIYGNVNYISTVEINYFYQGMKLLNELYKNFINELDFEHLLPVATVDGRGKPFLVRHRRLDDAVSDHPM